MTIDIGRGDGGIHACSYVEASRERCESGRSTRRNKVSQHWFESSTDALESDKKYNRRSASLYMGRQTQQDTASHPTENRAYLVSPQGWLSLQPKQENEP